MLAPLSQTARNVNLIEKNKTGVLSQRENRDGKLLSKEELKKQFNRLNENFKK
jgi:F420-dependent methylenetetrahydromethanopterin dehydrogenase